MRLKPKKGHDFSLYMSFDDVSHHVPSPSEMAVLIRNLESRGVVVAPGFVDKVRTGLRVNPSYLEVKGYD